MKLLLLLCCCLGFSLEGINALVKKAPKQVAKEHEQAFWAAASALNAIDIDKAKALVRENPQVLGCCESCTKIFRLLNGSFI